MSIIALSFLGLWLLIVGVYSTAIATLLFYPVRKSQTSVLDYFPKVSLAIPTYNEESIITRKLENLLLLDYPRDRLEVVVVDGASTDSTRDKVKRFADANLGKLNLTLTEQSTRQGKSSAVNEALRRSEGEVFVLTDADVVVDPQGLTRLVRPLLDPGVGGASGIEVPVGDQALMSRIESGYKSIYAATRMSEANVDSPLMCESEFSAFKRSSVRPLRDGCMCDDLELTVGLRSNGAKAVYISEAPFFEREAGVLRPKLLHKYRRGMANQHGLLRSRRVLFNKSFGKYGSIVYPFEFFVHIISPILLLSAFVLFVVSIVASLSEVYMVTAIAVVSGLLPVILLHQLIRKYRTDSLLKVRGGVTWVLGAAAFVGFQFVLIVSLMHLLLRGPNLQWAQIAETRVSKRGELQTAQIG